MALAKAEEELAQLNARRRKLEALIARARAVTARDGPVSPEPRARLTLHQAMAQVLSENANRWMSVHEIASEINDRELYAKRDGSEVDPSQIHARANSYGQLFEKDGARVRLASR